MPVQSKKIAAKAIKTNFEGIFVYTCSIKIKDALALYYVASRGKSQEEGAVQRILNPTRIGKIKKYVLDGNNFLNTFFLNWTEKGSKPEYVEKTNEFHIPLIDQSAQVIDGQHRLAGLSEAYKVESSIGEKEIIISMCVGLDTKQAASIFLNINTEQKTIPKSLIFDLYGEIEDPNSIVNRALDIAHELNEDSESPYVNQIKFPGALRGSGSVDLSTIVTTLNKPLSADGVLSKYNLYSFNNQKQVLINYFSALKSFYDKEDLWHTKSKNPFLGNTGFSASCDFFLNEVIKKCAELKSFKMETIISILNLQHTPLLLQSEIKGLGGAAQRKKVYEWLSSPNYSSLPSPDEYDI